MNSKSRIISTDEDLSLWIESSAIRVGHKVSARVDCLCFTIFLILLVAHQRQSIEISEPIKSYTIYFVTRPTIGICGCRNSGKSRLASIS